MEGWRLGDKHYKHMIFVWVDEKQNICNVILAKGKTFLA
jgi:hypothetical protein